MLSEPAKSLIFVLTNPLPGKEDEFNEWYTNTHLPEVVAVKGYISARRYKLSKDQMFADQRYRYMVIYEVESGKERQVLENLQAAVPSMTVPPVIDFKDGHAIVMESISDTVRPVQGS